MFRKRRRRRTLSISYIRVEGELPSVLIDWMRDNNASSDCIEVVGGPKFYPNLFGGYPEFIDYVFYNYPVDAYVPDEYDGPGSV